MNGETLKKLSDYAERLGITVTDGTYRSILAKGLTPEICRSFRDARSWALSRCWELIKTGEAHYLSEGLRRAWEELGEKCGALGVERVAVAFSPTEEKAELEEKVEEFKRRLEEMR